MVSTIQYTYIYPHTPRVHMDHVHMQRMLLLGCTVCSHTDVRYVLHVYVCEVRPLRYPSYFYLDIVSRACREFPRFDRFVLLCLKRSHVYLFVIVFLLFPSHMFALLLTLWADDRQRGRRIHS